MRLRFLAMLLSLCVFAQTGGKPFPIPAMQENWVSSALPSSDIRVLTKTIKADLGQCEIGKSGEESDNDWEFTSVSLGELGRGILVRVQNSCSCGATGNCAIYLYVQHKGKYRQIPICDVSAKNLACPGDGPSGWAFGVVPKLDAGVPDLVFASNASAGENVLVLYQYQNGKFSRHSCERLLAKGDESPKSWWDEAEVTVRSCSGS